MNNAILIGRLTADPDIRYIPSTQTAVATFTIAVNRPVKQNGEKQADFIRIKVFGKLAENCEKFTGKGCLIGIQGSIKTGSYENKNGQTVYTTDVVASRVEFLQWKEGLSPSQPQQYPNQQQQQQQQQYRPQQQQQQMSMQQQREYWNQQTQLTPEIPDDFQAIDEDVPF